jgi:hypothetical protein
MNISSTLRRSAIVGVAVPSVLALAAGTASAHQCVNASKQNQAAGVQIVFGDGEDPVWVSKGLQKRIDAGLVDMATGEGFHGLIGLDMDGDAVADLGIYIVGPTGEIPPEAQAGGNPCRGITDIGTYFAQCMELGAPL